MHPLTAFAPIAHHHVSVQDRAKGGQQMKKATGGAKRNTANEKKAVAKSSLAVAEATTGATVSAAALATAFCLLVVSRLASTGYFRLLTAFGPLPNHYYASVRDGAKGGQQMKIATGGG